MSVPGSQRRGQRRRLLVAWSRGSVRDDRGGSRAARAIAEYAPAALPERHPAIATLLPTGLGGLAAWATAIILTLTAVLAVGLHAPVLVAVGRAAGPRFTKSVAALGDCVNPGVALSLAGWLTHVLLLSAAVVALVVRFMRRHRRDDYAGRYRAWGWLACILVAASCAMQVPVGRLVGIALTEATGITLGPEGFGWWVALAAPLVAGVSLWAVLPLHERLATALWLSAGLTAWSVSAAATWVGAESTVHPGSAAAAQVAGSGLVAIAMLAAARSVIREVRGESGRAVRPASPPHKASAEGPTTRAEFRTADGAEQQPDWSPEASTGTEYTDGSDVDEERETRHLSKAERKRLRKLARMNRAA